LREGDRNAQAEGQHKADKAVEGVLGKIKVLKQLRLQYLHRFRVLVASILEGGGPQRTS